MQDKRGVGALLGPRVLGRLTPELILRSPQYMNCVNQYELDLRGSRITVIENLGATENQFDSIDLSDNTIVRLEGFPKLLRLSALYINNNKISRIDRNLHESIPNLEWLILTNNKINNLIDLEPLNTLPRLKYLSLIDNPVTKQPGYRLFVINRCKKLKVLDFRKIKMTEREEAEKMFGGKEAPMAAIAMEETSEKEGEKKAEPSIRKGPSAEQVMAIKSAIAAATTLEEVRRLEDALKTGRMPGEENGDAAVEMEEG